MCLGFGGPLRSTVRSVRPLDPIVVSLLSFVLRAAPAVWHSGVCLGSVEVGVIGLRRGGEEPAPKSWAHSAAEARERDASSSTVQLTT